MTFYDHRPTTLRYQRSITDKLDGIAEALFGMQQNDSAFEGRTIPERNIGMPARSAIAIPSLGRQSIYRS